MLKFLLIPLLLCAGLTPILSQPVASRIASTTQANTQYSSAPSITTGYSAVYSTTTIAGTIHYEHRPSDYNYRTGSFTLGEYEEISHPLPFPFEQTREHICLYYDYFVFNAAASQKIHLHFETANPVNFYVLSLEQLYSFYRYFCGHEYWSWEAKVFASSYDLDWVAPQNGVYVFLFNSNRAYGAYAKILFTANSTTVQTATLSYTITAGHAVRDSVAIVSSRTGASNSSQNLLRLQ